MEPPWAAGPLLLATGPQGFLCAAQTSAESMFSSAREGTKQGQWKLAPEPMTPPPTDLHAGI